jgi:hypothetical protein
MKMYQKTMPKASLLGEEYNSFVPSLLWAALRHFKRFLSAVRAAATNWSAAASVPLAPINVTVTMKSNTLAWVLAIATVAILDAKLWRNREPKLLD